MPSTARNDRNGMIQTFPRSPTHSYKHSESCQTTMRNDRLPQSAKPTNVPANPHTSVRQQRFQDYQQRIRHLHLHLQQHIANTIPPAAVAAAAIIINSNDSNSTPLLVIIINSQFLLRNNHIIVITIKLIFHPMVCFIR